MAQLQRPQGDQQAPPDQQCKQGQQHQHTQQAQFFGQYRQDEVRVGFRQVKQLLDAAAQAYAQPFTAADGYQGLGQLEPTVKRVCPGIQEGLQALGPVGLGKRSPDHQRQRHDAYRRQVTESRATLPDHGHGHPENQHRTAEIRLGQQQQGNHAGHRQGLQCTHEILLHGGRLPHQVPSQVDRGHQLHRLHHLEVQYARADPAGAAVDGHAEARDKHQHQQGEAQQHQKRAGPLQIVHGDPQADGTQAHAQP